MRVVLAHLELVAHHRHLFVEDLLFDARVHHAVGFQFERPAQVLIGRADGFEVIGAVPRRRAVHLRAVVGQFLLDVGARLGLAEHQVLQQVRHAGFAVAFLARTHQVGDVHRDLGLGGVRKQQHVQAVRIGVLGDAFDRRHLLHARRQRLAISGRAQQQRGGDDRESRNMFA